MRHSNSAGFTLIEVLVSLIITLILLLAIFGLLNSGLVTNRDARIKNNLQTSTDLTLNYLIQELRWSQAAGVVTDPSPPYFDQLLITPVSSSETISYEVDPNGRLFKKLLDGTVILLTPEQVVVEEFKVTNMSTSEEFPLFQIQLRLKSKTKASLPDYSSFKASVAISMRKREIKFPNP